MCAWKRGVQNNLPGAIRKGHIKEFLVQTSKEDKVSGLLRILEAEKFSDESYHQTFRSTALVCSKNNGLPESLWPSIANNSLWLHSHEYPRCIVTAILSDDVPYGSIVLNQAQLINSKVCSGELQEWSIFFGDTIMYDCKEGSLGDHRKRINTQAPLALKKLVLEIKLRDQEYINKELSSIANISCSDVVIEFTRSLFQCVLTVEDIYVVLVNGIPVVGRVTVVVPEEPESGEDEDDSDFVLPDHYRGIVDEFTTIYVTPTSNPIDLSYFTEVMDIPPEPPLKDVVEIYTSDHEVFPVKRKLLRPCIALTALVQAGKGKYGIDSSSNSSSTTKDIIEVNSSSNSIVSLDNDSASHSVNNSATINVTACTFDRVLLYLEHAARGDSFQFDPLLANELKEAAVTLGISGLKDACDKVLGSFQERVRRTPIRLSEVFARNAAGGVGGVGDDGTTTTTTVSNGSKDMTSNINSNKRRGDTLLLLSGMVLDITRWLDEHPGGSTIIPEQALNVDCTEFFEIYHASRQSFLYLKEFYIGELAIEDRALVPLPRQKQQQNPKEVTGKSTTYYRNVPKSNRNEGNSSNCSSSTITENPITTASPAFMEQLDRITSPWRLNVHSMKHIDAYKSF